MIVFGLLATVQVPCAIEASRAAGLATGCGLEDLAMDSHLSVPFLATYSGTIRLLQNRWLQLVLPLFAEAMAGL